MAMHFREPNEVRWVGVRPAHKGTQISSSDSVSNGTIDLYVNNSGNVSFVHYIGLSTNSEGAGKAGSLLWTNSNNVTQSVLIRHKYQAAGQMANYVSLHYPLELPNGHKLRVLSDNAGLGAVGSFIAWEE